jgi:ParB family chromosome partitioning protein
VEYELIAGERRWRAAKMARLPQVPVIIRSQEESDKMKLELAIIENLQREDLNPVDRALAFKKLQEHGYNNTEIARKIGKSREYVANTLRILNLPDEMLEALRKKQITEGFTRPLLMLQDRPEEQRALFREILERRLSVRETERIARRIARERIRHKIPPEVSSAEAILARALGTRVVVTPRPSGKGGKIVIDYFSEEDLQALLAKLAAEREGETASSSPSPTLHTTASPAQAPQELSPHRELLPAAQVVPNQLKPDTDAQATPPAPPRSPLQAAPSLSSPAPRLQANGPAPVASPHSQDTPSSLPPVAAAGALPQPPQWQSSTPHSTLPVEQAATAQPPQYDAPHLMPTGTPSLLKEERVSPAEVITSPTPETTTEQFPETPEDDSDLYAVHRFTI